jgi:extradiol dioxygenase family protein
LSRENSVPYAHKRLKCFFHLFLKKVFSLSQTNLMKGFIMPYPQFHLSIGVNSIEESADFFEKVLRAVITHRDPSGYINVDFYGCQITLQKGGPGKDLGSHFHFGANLSLSHFEELSKHILSTAAQYVEMAPETWDAETHLERRKMYVRCSSGYLVELKGYRAN